MVQRGGTDVKQQWKGAEEVLSGVWVLIVQRFTGDAHVVQRCRVAEVVVCRGGGAEVLR